MDWGAMLLILVTYCGGVGRPANVDACRNERLACMTRLAKLPDKKNVDVNELSLCLEKPDSYPLPKGDLVKEPAPAVKTQAAKPAIEPDKKPEVKKDEPKKTQ